MDIDRGLVTGMAMVVRVVMAVVWVVVPLGLGGLAATLSRSVMIVDCGMDGVLPLGSSLGFERVSEFSL